MQMSSLVRIRLAFQNFLQTRKQAETIRNFAKKGFGQESQKLTRLNKRKSLRVPQARAENREIKELFDPEKLTFYINSEHKSA